jgi:hypothetical protein
MVPAIVDISLEMTSWRRGVAPPQGYHANKKSIFPAIMQTADVTFEFVDGAIKRFQAVYLDRGQSRDVYEVKDAFYTFGQGIVVKLALPIANSSQVSERDALQRRSSRWLPKLLYFGVTPIGCETFEVVVTSQLACSLDKVMDMMSVTECTESAALYLEHTLREVMYMLLYSFEQQGISVGDLHVANVGVKRMPADLTHLSRDDPEWSAASFGREVVGVMCVDAESVEPVQHTGKVLNKQLKLFLKAFMQSILNFNHRSWKTVVQAFAASLETYITNEHYYSQSGMAVLRNEAAAMGVKIRGAIGRPVVICDVPVELRVGATDASAAMRLAGGSSQSGQGIR